MIFLITYCNDHCLELSEKSLARLAMPERHTHCVVRVEPHGQVEIIEQLDPADLAAGLLDQERAAPPAMMRPEQLQEPVGERVHAASRRRQSPPRGNRAGSKPNSLTVPGCYML